MRLQSVGTGADIDTYHARIGSFAANYKRKNTMGSWLMEVDEWQTQFWGFVLMVVLVMVGVEVHPDPAVEQRKLIKI